jgi:DNA-directed RNA polymerase subunit M/transcription elongation factor TFIIS
MKLTPRDRLREVRCPKCKQNVVMVYVVGTKTLYVCGVCNYEWWK